MTLRELNVLEAPLLQELARHDANITAPFDDRSYNGIRLISDEMYSEMLNRLYKPYATALLEFMEERKSKDIAELLEMKLERIRIIHYDQENKRMEVDGKLEELKSQREYINRNVGNNPLLINDIHALNGKVDSWWRYSHMLQLQLGYINRLIRVYNTGKAFQETDLSIPVLAEYKPFQYEENIRWLVSVEQLLELIQFFLKNNYITGLSSGNLNKLISLFTFANDELTEDFNYSDYKLELHDNDERLLWVSKNVDFSEVYWWLVVNDKIYQHGEGRLTAMVRSILEVIDFKEISSNTKNPVESIRRTIEQYEKNKIISQSLPDTPLTHSLAKLFESEEGRNESE